MSYTSGFFDAIDQGGGDYDRVYSAATFAHYFSLLVKNGVFPDPSTGLQVRASSNPNMQVSVSPGSGWINGYYITVPDNSPEVLTVPTANPSLSRYDSVIMGLNFVDREIQLYIKSGAVSASPSAVTLQRDSDLYELELARILVGAGVASITQSLITDTRSDSTRCGIVAGMIDQIDTTDLFAQYDDAFHTWFADIQAQLSGDVATNLQNQIDSIYVTEKVATLYDVPVKSTPNSVFEKIFITTNYTLGVKVSDSYGNPVSGCVISVDTPNVGVTDDTGWVYLLSPASTVTVTCTSPIDFGAESQSKSVDCSDGKYREIEFTVSKSISDQEIDFTSSILAAFSGEVTDFDVFVLGAGGNGGVSTWPSSNYYASSGGGSGGGSTRKGITNQGKLMRIEVAAGGAGFSSSSSVKSDDGSISVSAGSGGNGQANVQSASGGSAGTGDVPGASGGSASSGDASGSANKGGNSTVRKFNEPDGTLYGGGGGGCGTGYGGNGGTKGGLGGSPGGGNGAYAASGVSTSSGGSTFGAGGGARYANQKGSTAGMSGLVSFRWRKNS